MNLHSNPKTPTQRQYWSFYWPLTLTGLAMVMARQFQNGALARYPDAEKELATFAFAASTFFLFNTALGFVPQMSNVLARSKASHRICFRFIIGASLILTAPIAFLGFAPPGKLVLASIFEIEGPSLDNVARYLRYLTPLILINGLRFYNNGLLIQAKRTVLATVLNALFLATAVAVLVTGVQMCWRPVETLALAQLASAAVHLLLSWLFLAWVYQPPGEPPGQPALTLRRTFDFFWPVAVTASLFALSRPIIYAYASRMPDGVASIAAMRVAFDFVMVFQNPVNQFRNLFVTFGCADLQGVRRFMIRVWFGVTALMLLVIASPIGNFLLQDLIGVRGDLFYRAREILWVLCLVPLVLTFRNFFHGLSLVRRTTGNMAAGSFCRILVIWLASWALWRLGRLDHLFGAAILLAGFAMEAAFVAGYAWFGKRRDTGGEIETLGALGDGEEP
ncbi:MAG: hypothetical protein ACYTHM_10735 [Planctomycetota bacterium]|jgi:hypothetical protein